MAKPRPLPPYLMVVVESKQFCHELLVHTDTGVGYGKAYITASFMTPGLFHRKERGTRTLGKLHGIPQKMRL